jgi:arginase family enzyme
VPQASAEQAYLALDDAWPDDVLGLPIVDAREWRARLRYVAPRRLVEAFAREVAAALPPFVLYGSGDYHYLSGVLVRHAAREPLTLVSFDNHPDWDVRPPYWSCGGWAARATRLDGVRRASVWGCGNFELRLPARFWADHRALRSGRLEVHAWAERQPSAVRRRFDCIARDTWRDDFARFAAGLGAGRVYVTVDMDCLRDEEAVTNWETGLFTADDVAWALRTLHEQAEIVAGDVCGAWSPPVYERLPQRIAGAWDHPALASPDRERARRVNLASLERIWPALSGGPHSSG